MTKTTPSIGFLRAASEVDERPASAIHGPFERNAAVAPRPHRPEADFFALFFLGGAGGGAERGAVRTRVADPRGLYAGANQHGPGDGAADRRVDVGADGGNGAGW